MRLNADILIKYIFKRIFFLFIFSFSLPPVSWLSLWAAPAAYYQGTGTGFKYVRNYTIKEYGGQPQNWWILQDQRGVIYVGNNGGLLEFDGVSWREIEVPNKTVRSMTMDDAGTIYIGGKKEFGYLAPDAKGSLEYVSLLDKIEDANHRDFSEVWKTYATKKGVYFQAREFLFRGDKNSREIKVWKPGNDRFYFSFYCAGTLFIRRQKIGLLQIDEDSDSPVSVPGGEFFADKKIFMMAPYGPEKLLIGTEADGFYLYDGKRTERFPMEADDYIKEKILYHGIRLSTGDFALATLLGGVVIIDANGRLKEIFTKTYGLLDDDVKYVFEDKQGNLWLALINGLSRVEYHSPVSLYDGRADLPVLVLSVAGQRGALYAGTTRGLYVLSSSPGKFKRVPPIASMCWSLLSVDGSLLAATSNGVFQVEKENAVDPPVIPNPSYVLLRSDRDKNRIWVGTREGLSSLCLPAGKDRWTKEYIFNGITREIRTIVEDQKGNLWLGTAVGEVLKVAFDGDAAHPLVTRFDKSHGLPPGEVHVFKAARHVLFATDKGIFRFDEQANHFISDRTFGDEFAGGPNGKNVFRTAEDKNKNTWLYSRTGSFQAKPGPGDSFTVIPIPLLKPHTVQVNAIYPDPDRYTAWFACQECLIRYDTTTGKKYETDFPTLLRKVLVGGRLVFDGYQAGQPFPLVDYKDRNLRFQFAAPFFEGESETWFRTLLEGYEDEWTGWIQEPQKEYTNLNSGLYTFRVQAKNVYEHVNREAVFQFKVLPPIYKTWWACSLYTIAAFMLVFLFVKWRSGKLEREKQILEHTVKERTKEIAEKNRQLETQTLQLKDQSEKLKEMDAVKSRFFANISHEFRTPLTLIMGPLEQMLDKRPEKEQEKQYHVMLRNSQRLLGLINQLLELSKFDSGKVKLRASRQNIIPFLKGLTASFESVAQKNRLDLAFHPGVAEIDLFFDPGKLEEVIFNLLSNAVKFTPAGGKITVTVDITKIDFREENFPSGSLGISVRDSGPGIPGDQSIHLFERFFQSASTHEYHGKGSGIGLAIVKELVELHHGRIDVHTGEGEGSEFIIRLPMGNAHLEPGEIVEVYAPAVPVPRKTPPGIQGPEETAGAEGGGGADERDLDLLKTGKNIVLVVEDSADVRAYIRGALEPLYKVVEAKDGQEGIKKALDIIPDLIISDIMMPGKDGYELCRFLKKDLKTSHVPIILLTAKASEENIIQGLETGVDDYITKPFNTKILCARIKNLIDLRCQLQQKIQRQMILQPVEIAVSSIDESFLKELRDIIEKNLSDPGFDIDQLCKHLIMGRATVFRKISALTGETPKQFIQSYRLERAAQLLKADFGNITEVAFEVGFSSSAYFTKCFKEKFHQLPSVYQAS